MPFDISDPTFPDMNYGFDPLYIPAGRQHFDGLTTLKYARTRHVDNDFGGVMEQASATFRANARSFVIILSILFTLLLGTDSIQLAQTLWNNAGVRALAVAQAELVVRQDDAEARMDDLIQQLLDLNIVRIGWWQTELPPAGRGRTGGRPSGCRCR